MSSSEESCSSSSGEEKKIKKTPVKKTKKDPKTKKGKKEKRGKRGRKKNKDENAPRRYLSPFIYFSKEYRPTVKAQNPSSTFGEIGSLLGQKWSQISADEKKKYEKMAAEDKKRWEVEKKQYEEKLKSQPAEPSSGSSDESE
ncbi:hypothetical protein DICPUDRAFT_91948 [Dictyostelium purpureum]|uniref:HMG box domain-containing protein n=1 Tax=Dictyostelium purpureum TaxID=5786 RepID=F0ZJP3_DICPU|nr:uncharacterized protein DICPUDRAFT_91948 [Dictyostelium purpureum]EGC35839.1 hypothetical protein DICPUDRAFT_91948 [Dictyostelium purpureum]|eukprot:XP_003287628.1 hypothetical protein DICPUDRAFT_91948 [Dictyostelium purpureum]